MCFKAILRILYRDTFYAKKGAVRKHYSHNTFLKTKESNHENNSHIFFKSCNTFFEKKKPIKRNKTLIFFFKV